MPDTDKCPLCGGKVLYRGFTAIECASRKEQCRNASRTVLDLNGAIAWYDAYPVKRPKSSGMNHAE